MIQNINTTPNVLITIQERIKVCKLFQISKVFFNIVGLYNFSHLIQSSDNTTTFD
jgi:hypothetical protein